MTPKIPPLYSPPSSSPSATSSVDSISFNPINRASSTTTDPSQSPELSSLLDSTTSRLALLRINPLGPLSYAWRISDEAMHAVESRADEKAKKGMMNEPVGAGVGIMLLFYPISKFPSNHFRLCLRWTSRATSYPAHLTSIQEMLLEASADEQPEWYTRRIGLSLAYLSAGTSVCPPRHFFSALPGRPPHCRVYRLTKSKLPEQTNSAFSV